MGSDPKKASQSTGLRQSAEKKLKQQTTSIVLPLTERDTLKLIHELQVHKIELEMQKEELLRSHQELEASRDRYSMLYDFAPISYFTLTVSGAIQTANLTGAKLLGIERSRLLNTNFMLFLAAADRRDFADFLSRVFSSPKTEICELMLSKSDGTPFFARIEASTTEEECLMAVIDISESKRAEQALRQAKQEWERTFDSIPELIAIMDNQHHMVRANRAMAEYLGTTQDQCVGQFCFSSFHETDCPPCFCPHIMTMNDGGRHESEVADTQRGRVFMISTTPLLDQQGELSGVVHTARDITVQKQLEVALQEYSEMLEDRVKIRTAELREKDRQLLLQNRLAAMGEMINSIAHQWRQPLNILGLNIQRLSVFYGSDKFSREFLTTSTRDAMQLIQHMSQTIDDFQNFFKPDKQKTDFDVHQAIQQAIKLVNDSFTNNQVKIIAMTGGDCCINGYPNEFSQVILNILLNARDALLDHKQTDGVITITSATENGFPIITISDNAGGIPEDIIDKIFEPYFSTKGVMGTGIGLYMSKNIIENNMGGRLTVRNNNEGAEFKIEMFPTFTCALKPDRLSGEGIDSPDAGPDELRSTQGAQT